MMRKKRNFSTLRLLLVWEIISIISQIIINGIDFENLKAKNKKPEREKEKVAAAASVEQNTKFMKVVKSITNMGVDVYVSVYFYMFDKTNSQLPFAFMYFSQFTKSVYKNRHHTQTHPMYSQYSSCYAFYIYS